MRVKGGVAQAGDILFTPLRRHLRAFAVLGFRELLVRVAPLACDAGLVSAAAAVRCRAVKAGRQPATG